MAVLRGFSREIRLDGQESAIRLTQPHINIHVSRIILAARKQGSARCLAGT